MMRPFRGLSSFSTRNLVIAAILTALTLALWEGWTPEVNILADPLTRVDNGTHTFQDGVKRPFVDTSRKVSKAVAYTLFPFVWFLDGLSVSIANHLSQFSAKLDRPWQYLFSKPSEKPFFPPGFYETDRHGAIEVFEKHGVTVCRIYKVCRLHNGDLQAPQWMSKHSSVLKKCGLPPVQYKSAWTLKSRFGIPPYYDWLAPDLSTYNLLKFTKTPLSYFFAHKSAKKSLLDDQSSANKVKRKCYSPFAGSTTGGNFSRICSSKPEGRVSNPAFLVNMKANDAQANDEFQNALTAEFFNVHGVEADVFEPTSALLRKPKACFRSVIIAPGVARSTNRKVSTSTGKKGKPDTGPSSLLASADDVIKKELAAEAKKKISVKNKATKTTTRSTSSGTKSTNMQAKTTPKEPATKERSGHSRTLLQTSDHADVFKIEGGVEMFTHREVDGKQWNSTKGLDDPMKHVYGVCRIHRACRRPDQVIVLPEWMHKFQRDLETHCGLSAVSYVSNEEFDTAFDRLNKPVKRRNGREPRFFRGQANREVELDLMGTRVYRSQEQHFMTDFFHDGMHAFDALFNHPRGRHSIFKRRCMYKPNSQVGREIEESRDCVNVRTPADELNPALVLHERVQQRNPSTKYIHQVLAMMPKGEKSGPKVILSPHVSSAGPQESACFRSIILTRNSYPPKSVLQDKEGNVFFAGNNISRISIHDEPKHTESDHDCRVRLTLLKPRKVAMGKTEKKMEKLWASRLPAWEIQNKDEILSHVRQLAGKNITIDIREFSHETKSATDARKAMQETELILGANNPAMTSIAFARPQTSVVEIQPFAYSTGPYRSFARSLHLRYHSVTAVPDEERFANCVRENYQQSWDEGVELKAMEEAKEGLLELFRKASGKYDGSLSELDISKPLHKDGRYRTGRIPMERVCARAQRLRVDAKHVAELIVRDAQAYCDRRRNKPVMLSLSGKDI